MIFRDQFFLSFIQKSICTYPKISLFAFFSSRALLFTLILIALKSQTKQEIFTIFIFWETFMQFT